MARAAWPGPPITARVTSMEALDDLIATIPPPGIRASLMVMVPLVDDTAADAPARASTSSPTFTLLLVVETVSVRPRTSMRDPLARTLPLVDVIDKSPPTITDEPSSIAALDVANSRAPPIDTGRGTLMVAFRVFTRTIPCACSHGTVTPAFEVPMSTLRHTCRASPSSVTPVLLASMCSEYRLAVPASITIIMSSLGNAADDAGGGCTKCTSADSGMRRHVGRKAPIPGLVADASGCVQVGHHAHSDGPVCILL
ncbi:hypothetical protein BC828DRAFT_240200 [Blastocladiella britannica]|nr:hypothetical protein BC828DRAFT_240200 [Blastocladiella britannica]